MTRAWAGLGVALLLVSGCSKKIDGGQTATTDWLAKAPVADAAAGATAGAAAGKPRASPAPVAVAPRIAYTYSYHYRIPAKHLAEVARAHQAICEALGPTRCVVVNASLDGQSGGFENGMLQLRVAPDLAVHFADQLTAAAVRSDGALIGSQVKGEDLTKQVVDAEAGLRAKATLRDRLQQLLEHRDGKLADLLEVERALAQTQGELDAATGLLAELRQRLAMSEVTIAYESETPTGSTGRPIARAIAGVGDAFSISLSFLITTLAYLGPFAAVGTVIWLVARARRRKRDAD